MMRKDIPLDGLFAPIMSLKCFVIIGQILLDFQFILRANRDELVHYVALTDKIRIEAIEMTIISSQSKYITSMIGQRIESPICIAQRSL